MTKAFNICVALFAWFRSEGLWPCTSEGRLVGMRLVLELATLAIHLVVTSAVEARMTKTVSAAWFLFETHTLDVIKANRAGRD